jgi:drug/metabolite transporter (DMT)-like permease
MLVNYLLPLFALLYGAVFLGEAVTVVKVVGLALILIGVTLASGIALRARTVRADGGLEA